MAINPTSVPAGVRTTLSVLAQIHAELAGSTSRTFTGQGSSEHATALAAPRPGAQRGLRAQPPTTLKEAS